MRKNSYDLEVILTSRYCNIIMGILRVHKSLSINKLIVFAYIKNKTSFHYKTTFDGKNKKNLVYKCLSLVAGNIDDFCRNIQYILEAVHLLIENGLIILHLSELIFIEDGEFYNSEKSFFNSAIEESKSMTDKQFMKEVLKNV